MRRIRQGWELTKKSWHLLREHNHLIWFVVLGGIFAFVFTAAFAVPGVLLLEGDKAVPGVILLAVGGYLAAFIGIYFNVGLASAADSAMKGQPSSLGQGLSAASRLAGPIAGWAFVTVTINLILSAIQSESGILGRIVAGLFSMAWNLVTFLVVPVIALEGIGPISALKRSASLFKKRWGQQVTGTIAIGGAVALFTVLPAMLLGFLGVMAIMSGGSGAIAGGAALLVVAIALFVTGIVVSGALRGIFGVALYHFADTGEAPGGFTSEELMGSIQSKKGRAATI